MEMTLPFDVSRETLAKLECYFQTLAAWNKKHNLTSDLENFWQRHVLDSAQLIPYLSGVPVIDLGSGAGFPGLIISLMQEARVYLLERRLKKVAFLEHITHILNLSAVIVTGNIDETIAACAAEHSEVIITARALGSLSCIFDLLRNVSRETQITCLLHKSQQQLESEIPEALEGWNFQWESYTSLSDPKGRILRVTSIVRK